MSEQPQPNDAPKGEAVRVANVCDHPVPLGSGLVLAPLQVADGDTLLDAAALDLGDLSRVADAAATTTDDAGAELLDLDVTPPEPEMPGRPASGPEAKDPASRQKDRRPRTQEPTS